MASSIPLSAFCSRCLGWLAAKMPWVWVDSPIHYTAITVTTAPTGTNTIWFGMNQAIFSGGGGGGGGGTYFNPYQDQTAYLNQQVQQNFQQPLPPQDLRPASPAIIREREEAQERRMREYRRLQEEQEAATRVADGKAEDLLRRLLDPDQLAQLEARGYFDVSGTHGRRYRIRRGKIANIEVFDGNIARHRLCVHPVGAHELPVGDVMAAQLLHLRANENEVLRIANRHPIAN